MFNTFTDKVFVILVTDEYIFQDKLNSPTMSVYRIHVMYIYKFKTK